MMLGKLSIVKEMLKAFPGMKHASGPHDIPLIDHAKAGNDEATKVVS